MEKPGPKRSVGFLVQGHPVIQREKPSLKDDSELLSQRAPSVSIIKYCQEETRTRAPTAASSWTWGNTTLPSNASLGLQRTNLCCKLASDHRSVCTRLHSDDSHVCVRRALTLASSSSHLELRCALFQTLHFKLEFSIFAWPLIMGSPGLGAHLCQAHCPWIALPCCSCAPPFFAPTHPGAGSFSSPLARLGSAIHPSWNWVLIHTHPCLLSDCQIWVITPAHF